MATYRLKRKLFFSPIRNIRNFFTGTTKNTAVRIMENNGVKTTYNQVTGDALKNFKPVGGGEFTGGIYSNGLGGHATVADGKLTNLVKTGDNTYSLGNVIEGTHSYGVNNLSRADRLAAGAKGIAEVGALGTAGFLGYQGVNAIAGTTGDNSTR